MTKPNDPITPVNTQSHADKTVYPGLTKRELFAVMMAQATRSNPNVGHLDPETVATIAVKDADALIAALNK